MQYVVTCTFELKRARPECQSAVASALEGLGFRPVPQPDGEDRPNRIVLGSYESPQAVFLRNCICFKLRQLFDAQGVEWNAFVLVSGQESAWATMASRPKAADPDRRWAIVLSEQRGAAEAAPRLRAVGGKR